MYNLLSDEQALLDGIRRVRERSESSIAPKQARLEQITKLIDDKRRNLDRLIADLAEIESDIIRNPPRTP